MNQVLVGKNGFLAQAMQRVEDVDSLSVIGSADFNLLSDEPRIIEAMQGADVLYDCADYYPGVQATSQNPVEVYERNVQLYEKLFALAQINNVKKIVTIGTTGCYPVTNELLSEDMFDGDVNNLNQKLASYALSRFTLLDISALYRSQHGIKHSHLILPNFYGTGDKYEVGRSHLLASWIRDFKSAQDDGKTEIELWGPPTQKREFIFTDDAARCVFALGKLQLDHEVLNVGTDTAPTYEDMAKGVLKALGYECRLEWDLTKQVARQQEVMDISAMKTYLPELPPVTPFEQGVAITVEDYLHGTRN